MQSNRQINRQIKRYGRLRKPPALVPLFAGIFFSMFMLPVRADDDAAIAAPLALAFTAAQAAEAVATDYRYTVDYNSLQVSLSARIDPAAEEGARLTIASSSVAEDAGPERLDAVIADLDRGAPEEYWCSRMLEAVPEDAELLETAGGLAVYRFQPLPTGNRNDGFVENLQGEISIDSNTGAVRSFRLHAPRPFRQAVIAKISQFELTTECAQGPDGRTYASDFRMQIKGSAAFRGFEDRVVRRISILPPTET